MFRVGIIGLGSMGNAHLNCFISGAVKNAKITALCDINPEKLDCHREALGDSVKYFEKSDDLIASGLVDGVIIATPHYDHPIIAMAAFNAGLHVLCEKPVGVYTKNIRELNETARKSGKAFQVDFCLRTNSAFKKIKELVDAGELGEIKRIVWIITDWYRTQNYFNSGGWRATWAGEGGGTMINQNPHQLDLMQWIGGMPKRVWSTCYFGKNRDIEVEDEATAYFEYENGAVGLYMTSVSEYPGTNRLEIAGDRGKLVYENNKITFYRTTVGEKEFNKTTDRCFGPIPMWECDVKFDSSSNNMVADMINNWTEVATVGGKLIAPGYEGINSLALSNAMYMSTWQNKWIDLPLDEDAFYDLLQEKIKNSTFVKKVSEQNLDTGDSFHK